MLIRKTKQSRTIDSEKPDFPLLTPKTKAAGDGTNLKGSIKFQVFMNDIGMLKLKDKIPASESIALTKAQRTRQVQTRITEEEANKLKVVAELHKHMIKQQSKESSN